MSVLRNLRNVSTELPKVRLDAQSSWTNILKFGILRKMTPNEILSQILDDVERHTNCAAVFDLDSTLFCVSPRSQAILQDLSKEKWFIDKFPEAAKHLSNIEIQPTEYGIKAALIRTGLKPTPELSEAVRKYWRKHFFSNSHLRHDLIYPGAEEFVTRVHEGGATVFYLTGRNDAAMRAGTMLNLRTWKFPDIPVDRVIMKPSDLQSDETYKEDRLKELSVHYERIWFFENEPAIIHQVRKALPDVRIVFIDSAHSGKANPPTDLLTVRMDFR